MKSSGKKLSLASYDELFQSEDARQDDQRERVMKIPLTELHHFRDHPFQVRHDQTLQDMADSIKEYGVLSPSLVRPLPDGGYEVISGNRRMEASILAGLISMPVIVREMTDDEAIIAMMDAKDVRQEKTETRKSLGEAIKHHRTRCKMTQEFVAEAIGVSRQAVSKWESGISDPSTSNLIALAKLFSISAEDLLKEVE